MSYPPFFHIVDKYHNYLIINHYILTTTVNNLLYHVNIDITKYLLYKLSTYQRHIILFFSLFKF